MKRSLTLGALIVVAACGSTTPTAIVSPASPSPSASAVVRSSEAASESPAAASPSPVPSSSPEPSPVPVVSCKAGSGGTAMVMIGSYYGGASLIYDVSDPTHPRLLCSISNTSAHLFTGDTFAYLKAISPGETDVILHSLGSGNESKAASFPINITDPFRQDIETSAWAPDGSLLAYSVPDESNYTLKVFVYAQGRTSLVHTAGLPIGDCICRFGLPHRVLSFSPDEQFLVTGWVAGKGSSPLTVIRVSDGSTAFTAPDTTYYEGLWGRDGHKLYLIGSAVKSWSPETGLQGVPGGAWTYVPGISPDGTTVAYTAYVDTNNPLSLRVYDYDLKAAQPKLLVDKLRSQVLFVKDGWVWYLDERSCDQATEGCPGSTVPTGNIFAMQLSTGVEQAVNFAPGENPLSGRGWTMFTPGEYWPNS